MKRNVVNHRLFWDVFFSFHSQVTMNKENFYSASVWLSLGFLSFCQCYILVIISSCVRFHAPHLRRINESLTVDLHLRFLLTLVWFVCVSHLSHLSHLTSVHVSVTLSVLLPTFWFPLFSGLFSARRCCSPCNDFVCFVFGSSDSFKFAFVSQSTKHFWSLTAKQRCSILLLNNWSSCRFDLKRKINTIKHKMDPYSSSRRITGLWILCLEDWSAKNKNN